MEFDALLVFLQSAQFAFLVAVTIGLVELTKRIGLPDRYAPVVASLATGVGITTLLLPLSLGTSVIIVGLVVGLSASGLYSGTRALVDR